MDRTRDALSDAKDRISDALQNGITTEHFVDVAEMLKAIETIESFLSFRAFEGMTDAARLMADAADELAAAEKYQKRWTDTGDASYKTLGRDELKHADQFLRLAGQKAETPTDKARLQELMSRYTTLLKGM